jgi:hypothetical protein
MVGLTYIWISCGYALLEFTNEASRHAYYQVMYIIEVIRGEQTPRIISDASLISLSIKKVRLWRIILRITRERTLPDV